MKSRDRFPQLSLAYDNLLISCEGNTCGKHKGTNEFPASISYANWQECFAYLMDGRIKPKDENDKDADFTISILNLNEASLVRARRAVYDECLRNSRLIGKDSIKKYYIDLDEKHKLPRFSPMIAYFYEMGHFDECVANNT